MLAEVYRGEWDADALLSSRLLGETRAIFGKAVDKGTPRSTPHRTAFKRSLKTSTDVFSAFRVHRQAADVAALLTGDDGRRVDFGEWAAKAQPYLNHQNRAWLMTEYSTAVRRAHDEADWQRFREDADIYPNLEWVPSTSAHPGADHKVFWGMVLPVADPFWSSHRPGDRWNCKCSLRPTDRPASTAPRRAAKADDPQPGLGAKPGSGEVFSTDHPYFPASCASCPFGGALSALAASLRGGKRDCNRCPKARKALGGRKPEEGRVRTIVGDVSSKGFSTQPPAVVGNIEGQAVELIKGKGIFPESAEITLPPNNIAHALRDAKRGRGAALTAEELADICDLIRTAEIYYDPSHRNLLYVARRGDRVLKIVVQPNYTMKKMGKVNAVVTAGIISEDNVRSGGYERIK